MGVRLARTVDIATVAKICGFDWLFIELVDFGALPAIPKVARSIPLDV